MCTNPSEVHRLQSIARRPRGAPAPATPGPAHRQPRTAAPEGEHMGARGCRCSALPRPHLCTRPLRGPGRAPPDRRDGSRPRLPAGQQTAAGAGQHGGGGRQGRCAAAILGLRGSAAEREGRAELPALRQISARERAAWAEDGSCYSTVNKIRRLIKARFLWLLFQQR